MTIPSTQISKQINYVQYDILRNNRSPFEAHILPHNLNYEKYTVDHQSVMQTQKQSNLDVDQEQYCSQFNADNSESRRCKNDINQIYDQNKQDLRDLIHKMNDQAIKKRQSGKRRSSRKESENHSRYSEILKEEPKFSLQSKPSTKAGDSKSEQHYSSQWSHNSSKTPQLRNLLQENHTKLNQHSMETLNYDSQQSTTTNKFSNISDIPLEHRLISGEVRPLQSKQILSPNNFTQKSQGEHMETFFVEHQEEQKTSEQNYFSDFGDLHNLVNSSKKDTGLHEVTKEGKILAKLNRDRNLDPPMFNVNG